MSQKIKKMIKGIHRGAIPATQEWLIEARKRLKKENKKLRQNKKLIGNTEPLI